VVARLTGEYVVDHYTASASDPLYHLASHEWWDPGWKHSAAGLERPRLAWPAEIVGTVLPEVAHDTGLRPGTPVVAGTIDAMAEAHSVGCSAVGDTMVMYGSTLFFIQVLAEPMSDPGLWAVAGLAPEKFGVAAGMATSGLVTTWMAEVANSSVADLFAEAAGVPAGSEGLVLLPYFAGERTPLFDPGARGCWLGLTLGHTRAHLARSILEGVAFGVRHNIEAMAAAGSEPRRLVAVGGGTRGDLWMRVVSDVTGLAQDVPTITVGASFGDARLAADALGIDTTGWNPASRRIDPNTDVADTYDRLYGIYRRAYPALRDDLHRLAEEFGVRDLR
jgi:xylulokinase